MDLICVYTALTDCLCCSAGQHVAIHPSGGASGCRRNRHWSGKCCPHGWNRDVSSDHRIHFRHQEQVIMLCAAKLSTTHSLICGLSSRVAKIPLWRWQWMVIYMLINAFGCIISSVLLNIVDHRQVRQRTNTRIQAHTHTSTHTHSVLCLMHWQQAHCWYLSFPRAGSWTIQRKSASRQRETMTVTEQQTGCKRIGVLICYQVKSEWFCFLFISHHTSSSDAFIYFRI